MTAALHAWVARSPEGQSRIKGLPNLRERPQKKKLQPQDIRQWQQPEKQSKTIAERGGNL
jgi:hypothetical protein